MKSHKGFTLIEIMIGVGLLGIVIVTVCGVFIKGLHAIKKGKYRAGAIHVANQKFDEIKEADWGEPQGLPTAGLIDCPPSGYIEGFLFYEDPGGYGSYIDWDFNRGDFAIYGLQDMAGIEYNFDITVSYYQNNIKRVTTKVMWEEIEGEKSLNLCTLVTRRE